MKILLSGIVAILLSMVSCISETSSPLQSVRIQSMHGFPHQEPGYEAGVSAAYAAVAGDWLVLAGGCNFAGKPAAEGGAKCYYRGIYTAKITNDSLLVWKKAGELPVPAAYGVSVTLPDGRAMLIGGNNVDGGLATVYGLKCTDGGEVTLDTLPPLPYALDNMAGAALNHTVYVVGGNAVDHSSGSHPSTAVLSLNLDEPASGWKEELSLPGAPRVQPVCAVQGEMVYVWGGFCPPAQGVEASVATDGYRYLPAQKVWQPVSSPVAFQTGETFTLTGGAAVACADSLILCAGGVDRAIFLDAISGNYQRVAKEAYLKQPVPWYRFNGRLMAYHTRSGQWDEWTASPSLARAGAAFLRSEHGLWLIGGEIKPGIRTPEIVRILIAPSHNRIKQ